MHLSDWLSELLLHPAWHETTSFCIAAYHQSFDLTVSGLSTFRMIWLPVNRLQRPSKYIYGLQDVFVDGPLYSGEHLRSTSLRTADHTSSAAGIDAVMFMSASLNELAEKLGEMARVGGRLLHFYRYSCPTS
jgi:hypothetical protein